MWRWKALSEDQCSFRGVAKFATFIKICESYFVSWIAQLETKMTMRPEVKKPCIARRISFHGSHLNISFLKLLTLLCFTLLLLLHSSFIVQFWDFNVLNESIISVFARLTSNHFKYTQYSPFSVMEKLQGCTSWNTQPPAKYKLKISPARKASWKIQIDNILQISNSMILGKCVEKSNGQLLRIIKASMWHEELEHSTTKIITTVCEYNLDF